MDGTLSPVGLRESVGHQLSRTARLVERRVEDGLRQYGLTRIGWQILLAVEEAQTLNPSDIARTVGIDRTATSRALRQLEEDDLIARTMGRHDRRTTEVSLTIRGQQQLAEATPLCRSALDAFQANLTEAEVTELKRLLQRLRRDRRD